MELLRIELIFASENRNHPHLVADLKKRFPDYIELIDDVVSDNLNTVDQPISSEDGQAFDPYLATDILNQSATSPSCSVGPYKLLQEIGQGGMGTVYLAEQSDPVLRRVALKLIRPGKVSKAFIARFEVERQALAMMDHTNIAKVLDAGTTNDVTPYFVMELIRGIPIPDYCDKHKQTVLDRLNLLSQACHAIQHAHQTGIIHRDIKPSNFLVTLLDDKPIVKVIDFGLQRKWTKLSG